MSKLILCEGKTDAILISYYFERVCGWTHKNAPKNLWIKTDESKGESACWYKKDNDSLLICGVGGKDNFGSFFQEKINNSIVDSTAFTRIAVVTDRDDRSEQSIIQSAQCIFKPVINLVVHNQWITNQFENSYGQKIYLDFLLLAIPEDSQGALETLLLDAISENPEDKEIVFRCKSYVEDIAPIAQKYLAKNRLKLKAMLGVTWAIQYPEKIFSYMDQQIRSVRWEDSKLLEKCFHELIQI